MLLTICACYKIILVTLYILATIRKNSFFEPYYSILPDNLDNFPIFWNRRDLANLKGSNMMRLICERKKQVVEDYNELSRICNALIILLIDSFPCTGEGERNIF